MSRLFGILCNEPRRLVEALEPVRDALRVPGVTHGWGLGYVQGGEVLLRRHPRRVEDLDLHEVLCDVPSDYIIAHATDDDRYTGNENTQPFRYRRWLFAQQGEIDDFDALKGALLEHIPEFLRRNIRGKSPAEFVFHVFLASLHGAGAVNDHKLAPAAARRALRDALATVYGLIGQTGATGGPGNIVVTNSRSMLAVRIGQPLHVRRFRERGRTEGEDFRCVLVASGLTDAPEGFEEIPEGSAIAISRELQIDITQLESAD